MAVAQSGEILKQGVVYTRAFYYGTTTQTVTVSLSKAGASFTLATNSPAVEVGLGFYKLTLAAVDVNTLGDLAFSGTGGSGGPAVWIDQVNAFVTSDLNIDGSGNVSIASNVKKNQALNGFLFLMTSASTSGPAPALTVTAQRSLGSAGFAPCANSVVELSNGIYYINLAAADLNANTVMLRFTAPGANDQDILIITQP